MKKRVILLVVASFMMVFLLVSYTSWPIETPISKYLTPRDEYTEKIEDMVCEVMKDLSELRMLVTPDSVDLKVVTTDWVRENWGRRSAEAIIEEVKLEEEMYRVLFLISENFSLVDLKVEQAGTIMAAVAGNTLYVVREYFNPYDEENAKELLAHELTHILQGINFRVEEPSEFDGRQAKGALIEGDADFTSRKYMLYRFNRSVEKSFTPPSGNENLRDIDALWCLWVFPYAYGFDFIEALYNAGGWERVNEAYLNMPVSTEQVMHPEKYLSGEGFALVELENVEGWELKRSDRLGEHFIMIMLARHIGLEKAKVSAEGWAGDMFAYYKMGGEYLFIWKVVWDSPTDRDEFLSAFRELLKSVDGEEVAPGQWRTYQGYLTVEIDELTLTITGTSKPDALIQDGWVVDSALLE